MIRSLNFYITPNKIACFLLVLFCIQYIPIESRGGASIVKILVSLLCPFFWLYYSPKINKAFILLFCYFTFVCLTAIFHYNTFRISTLLFLLSHIFVFITYYNLLWEEKVFSLDFCLVFIRRFINVYFLVLILQQFFILIGIKYLPIINLVQILNRGVGANSLSYEPSSFAIVMAFLFLSLLRLYECKLGRKITILELFQYDIWVTIGFLWSMLTMGSGTAIIALAILCLYFFRKNKLFIIIIPLFLFCLIPYLNYEPLLRAYNSINAFITFDRDLIIQTDSSSAYRLVPLVNTITNIDLTDWNTWFGHGIDTIKSDDYFNSNKMIGSINEYGLLSFIIAQIFVFRCCIRKILSIETLMWIGLFNMSVNNVSFYWGALMFFSMNSFFEKKYKI